MQYVRLTNSPEDQEIAALVYETSYCKSMPLADDRISKEEFIAALDNPNTVLIVAGKNLDDLENAEIRGYNIGTFMPKSNCGYIGYIGRDQDTKGISRVSYNLVKKIIEEFDLISSTGSIDGLFSDIHDPKIMPKAMAEKDILTPLERAGLFGRGRSYIIPIDNYSCSGVSPMDDDGSQDYNDEVYRDYMLIVTKLPNRPLPPPYKVMQFVEEYQIAINKRDPASPELDRLLKHIVDWHSRAWKPHKESWQLANGEEQYTPEEQGYLPLTSNIKDFYKPRSYLPPLKGAFYRTVGCASQALCHGLHKIGGKYQLGESFHSMVTKLGIPTYTHPVLSYWDQSRNALSDGERAALAEQQVATILQP